MRTPPLFRLIGLVVVIVLAVVFGVGRLGAVKDLLKNGGETKDQHLYSEKNLTKFKEGLAKKGVRRLGSLDIRANNIEFDPAGTTGYPLSRLRVDVPQSLVDGIVRRSGGGKFYPSIISLEPDIISHKLGWSVHGTVNGVGVGYEARPDGSRLVAIGSAASRRDAIPPEVRRAQRRARCITRAAGDPERVQRCLR